MEPILELSVTLPPRGSRERLRALHRQLRAAIVGGRLRPGLRLPPTRTLAAAYGVARNTVVATYDLLLSEGYLATRRGAGTYVADALPQAPARKPAGSEAIADRRLNHFWLEAAAGRDTASRTPPRYDFSVGVPDQALFPSDVWRRLSARALRALSKSPAAYAEAQGRSALREAIAKHVSFTRAVACRADDVVVTAGAQQAFDLLARVLVTARRTVVAVENPGYPPMRAAFAAAGARLAAVPVDEEGLVVAHIPPQAHVICVTPSHQFPLGMVMSARRRAALLEFAQARGAVVIEDDYDSEFRFGGRPLDALQTLDRAESVFYVGTFSKSLFPAIRLGFVVAPPWALRALVAAKRYADWHCPVVAQDTLAAFITEGHLARHVRKVRSVYGERRQLLLDGLQRDFSRWLQPIPAAAGLHLAATGAAGLDAIVERARQAGAGVDSLRPYYLGKPTQRGLVFGYGAIDGDAIVEGLSELRRLFSRSPSRTGAGTHPDPSARQKRDPSGHRRDARRD